MRGSARHEEVNDALGLGGKHRRLGRQGIGRGLGREPADAGCPQVAAQQKRESRGPDAQSRLLEEVAARDGFDQIFHVRRIVIGHRLFLRYGLVEVQQDIRNHRPSRKFGKIRIRSCLSAGDFARGFRVSLEMLQLRACSSREFAQFPARRAAGSNNGGIRRWRDSRDQDQRLASSCRARACATSKNAGSLSVVKAWRGVLVRTRRTVQNSRVGASNVDQLG